MKKPAASSRKNVTINDIARQANVSKSTVSRVLNDSTPVNKDKREAVLEAMKAMNFEPNIFARSLAGGQTKTIGILTQNIGSPFYDGISQGILFRLTGTSYSPIFADGQWKPEIGHAAAETLVSRKVDGLILVGGRLPIDQLQNLRQRLPCIAVGRKIDDWESQCLYVDNEEGAFQAANYLIGLGHQKIAHITGIKDHPDSIQRLKGYTRALSEASIQLDPDLICEGQFDSESGVEAIETLLSRGKHFTAVFAANDSTAYGARLALYRKGIRVPEDVSLVGFDDQAESAFSTPPLTSVRQPAREMGEAAADALVKLINKQSYELPNIPPELIIRDSTQALN
jgi:LacI family transcriptional regulator